MAEDRLGTLPVESIIRVTCWPFLLQEQAEGKSGPLQSSCKYEETAVEGVKWVRGATGAFRANPYSLYSLPLTIPVQFFAPQVHFMDQLFGLSEA